MELTKPPTQRGRKNEERKRGRNHVQRRQNANEADKISEWRGRFSFQKSITGANFQGILRFKETKLKRSHKENTARHKTVCAFLRFFFPSLVNFLSLHFSSNELPGRVIFRAKDSMLRDIIRGISDFLPSAVDNAPLLRP